MARKYDGCSVGPNLRELRQNHKYTVEYLSELTDISVSTITQMEQGGRNLSMKNLYVLMDVYGVDANVILGIHEVKNEDSIDERLNQLSQNNKEYLRNTFLYMIENVEKKVS